MHGLVKYAGQMVVSITGIGGHDRSENAYRKPLGGIIIDIRDNYI